MAEEDKVNYLPSAFHLGIQRFSESIKESKTYYRGGSINHWCLAYSQERHVRFGEKGTAGSQEAKTHCV